MILSGVKLSDVRAAADGKAYRGANSASDIRLISGNRPSRNLTGR